MTRDRAQGSCNDLQVGSTILAQAAGVPTLPWSGSDVSVSYKDCGGIIPADVYRKACVHSTEETLECCNRIQYPCMLKASWGGGGKGIRKVAPVIALPHACKFWNMYIHVKLLVPALR